MKKIALVIPTLNETENIECLISQIKSNLENVTIFIIDDSKTNEIGELIKNKETGFHNSENNSDGVVKALDWIFNHPNESKKMGQKAKNLAFERHDLKITSTIKTSYYNEMIKNK